MVSESVKSVAGYILKSGEYVRSSEMVNKLMELQTQQLKLEDFSIVSSHIIEPPYAPEALIKCLELSSVHFRCVMAKAMDVAGDFIIKKKDNVEEADEKEKDLLIDFFTNCSDKESFIDVLQNMSIDLESVGWGCLEIGRNLMGFPSKLWHAPADTIRKMSKSNGFVQRHLGKTRYFQEFPNKCELQRNSRGEVEVKKWNLMSATTGKKLDENVSPLDAANEILFYSVYNPRSKVYGLPDFIPSIGSILGNVNARSYNLDKFAEGTVPAYAVVVTGAGVDEGIQTLIEQYFAELKDQHRSTLVLTVPTPNAKIEFVDLEKGVEDQSYTKYIIANRDDLLLAHGVPPARIGIIETANLGSGSGNSQMENYKRSVVDPKQRKLGWKMSATIIVKGFLINDWVFRFSPLDVKDRAAEADVLVKLKTADIMEKDEARESIGLKASKEEMKKVAFEEESILDSNNLDKNVSKSLNFDIEKIKADSVDSGRGLTLRSRIALKGSLALVWDELTEDLVKVSNESELNIVSEKIKTDLDSRWAEVLGEYVDNIVPVVSMDLGLTFTDEDRIEVVDPISFRFKTFLNANWIKDFNEQSLLTFAMSDEERIKGLEKVKTRMRNRSSLYAGLLSSIYAGFIIKSATKMESPVYWVNTSGVPCVDCAMLALNSPHSPSSLKQLPGDGLTQCRGNCLCYLTIYT